MGVEGNALIKRFEVDFNRQQRGGRGGRGSGKSRKKLRVTANDTLM